MTTTNTKTIDLITPAKRKQFTARLILDGLDSDETSNEKRAIELREKFESEYSWNVARIGRQPAIREWLLGLAINIPFYNSDILEICERMNVATESDAQQTYAIERYWDACAFTALQLMDGKSIPPDATVQVDALDFKLDTNGNSIAHYRINGEQVTKRRRQCGIESTRMEWFEGKHPEYKLTSYVGSKADGLVTAVFTLKD